MSRWGDPPETTFQILDGDTRTCHWPPLLRVLYERSRTGAAPPPVHPPVPDRLARLGTDRRARLVVGTAPERQPPSTPDYDALAAEVVREGLQKRGVRLDLVRPRPSAPGPAPIDGPVIVIGGPGSQRLSEAINQALARRAWGIRGFYFAPAGEASDRLGNLVRCWRLRAHAPARGAGHPGPGRP